MIIVKEIRIVRIHRRIDGFMHIFYFIIRIFVLPMIVIFTVNSIVLLLLMAILKKDNRKRLYVEAI